MPAWGDPSEAIRHSERWGTFGILSSVARGMCHREPMSRILLPARAKGCDMSVDGVWKIEMLGPYGWEGMATAFLNEGRYWAASGDHHSIGSYELHGEAITVDTRTVIYDSHRTLFGRQSSEYEVQFEGRLADDTFDGEAKDADGGGFLVRFRAMRVADLP